MRSLIKLLSFVPAVMMLCAIFSFSAQDGASSAKVSYHFSHTLVSVADDALELGLTQRQIDSCIQKIHFYVRKLAHFAEYFLLAVTVTVPLYICGLRRYRLLLAAGLFCCGCAALDELHQYFVEGRSASLRDVLIDTCGSLLGLLIAWRACAVCRMAFFRTGRRF